jgi:hypothetical protein
LEPKNCIKESSGPNQLILEHWFQKTWFFITKVDIGGGEDTYLISHKSKSNKHSFSKLLILVSSVTSDKKNFAPSFEQPPNLKISQQDSHNFHQSS